MAKFNVGDHVKWNSEAGHVSGKIIKVHNSGFEHKGHTHHASKDDPQYEIKSDKPDHIGPHKGSVLSKVWPPIQVHRYDLLIRLEKKFKLTERERSSGFAPYLRLYTLAANFLEMKVSQSQFQSELEEIRRILKPDQKAEVHLLYSEVEKLQ